MPLFKIPGLHISVHSSNFFRGVYVFSDKQVYMHKEVKFWVDLGVFVSIPCSLVTAVILLNTSRH